MIHKIVFKVMNNVDWKAIQLKLFNYGYHWEGLPIGYEQDRPRRYPYYIFANTQDKLLTQANFISNTPTDIRYIELTQTERRE